MKKAKSRLKSRSRLKPKSIFQIHYEEQLEAFKQAKIWVELEIASRPFKGKNA